MNRILRYRISPIVATSALSYWAIQILGPIENGVSVVAVIASATWIIYPLDPILDKRDRIQGEDLRSWTVIRLIIAMMIFVFAIIDLRFQAQLLAIIGLPLAICYAIPLGGNRLKDRSVTKIPFISFAVTIACLGLPLLQANNQQPARVAFLFITMFVLSCSNVIVCDLRDRHRDKIAGLNTLATDRPAMALKILRALFILICILGWIGIHEPISISMGQTAGLLLATILLNYAAINDHPAVITTLIADGSLTLPALFGLLIS